jgi:hypothetical protein
LCERETWYVTLREEHRLRVYERKKVEYLEIRDRKLQKVGEIYIAILGAS